MRAGAFTITQSTKPETLSKTYQLNDERGGVDEKTADELTEVDFEVDLSTSTAVMAAGRLTVFQSSGVPLAKQYSLDAEGKLIKRAPD